MFMPTQASSQESGAFRCACSEWTEWDLNPRLPPCEGGDLPADLSAQWAGLSGGGRIALRPSSLP